MNATPMTADDLRTHCLDWRGIDPARVCPECDGSGTILYATTGLWRGVGGMTPTLGACNKCWGSGDRTNPWPSHRRPTPTGRAEP